MKFSDMTTSDVQKWVDHEQLQEELENEDDDFEWDEEQEEYDGGYDDDDGSYEVDALEWGGMDF
jgi:hypothetical protein